jgi:hypothetical protein
MAGVIRVDSREDALFTGEAATAPETPKFLCSADTRAAETDCRLEVVGADVCLVDEALFRSMSL